MKDFSSSGFFALRTPLLPFDELLAWSDGLEASAASSDPKELEQMLTRDRVKLRARLLEIVSRPEIREALFIASPHLDEAFKCWETEPDTEQGRGIERALVRYFARMAGRATPFGLFSGCSVGLLGKETHLVLEDKKRYRRHTRLTMDYLLALTESLRADRALRNVFHYRPNSSLHRVAGRPRYVASRLKDNEPSSHLVILEDSDYLASTLTRAEPGASFDILAAGLVQGDVTLAEAEAYIEQLIESQIIVADIPISVTGEEAGGRLVRFLSQHPATRPVAEKLEEMRAELAAMDSVGLGVAPSRYRRSAQLLTGLPATPDLSRLFQVDMIKAAPKATLGKAVLTEISRGVDLLYRLEMPVGKDELTRFRENFIQRYEMREVPLLEALDEEDGVGFGAASDATPLLAGVYLPSALDEIDPPWGDRERILTRKLSEVLRSGAQEMILTRDDIAEMANTDPPPLPTAFAAMAVVIASSEQALAQGDFRVVLNSATGPSGARSLARFCYADEELRAHVERHLRAEEALQPEAIFAEIVHLPEGRSGFLCRPALRRHEIPYLGHASVELSEQISVTDLTVSVRNNRIVLRSRTRDCEVIPRLTTSHNRKVRNLSVYKFLCALQQQGVHDGWGWAWGVLRAAPFLPRVVTGRLVLRRAQWQVGSNELKRFGELRETALFQFIQRWRADRGLPRWVTVTEQDHRLPIDFDNVLSVETFVHLVRSREEVLLVEIYPRPDELCAIGPEGKFVHELFVPFIRNASSDIAKVQFPGGKNTTDVPPRVFPPGSEWLYAKLYTGSIGADDLLLETIAPLVRKVLASGAADRWFFIRYSDPSWHLRLRFHGQSDRLHTEVLPALQEALLPILRDGRVRRWQVDTYEREVERYGGPDGIALAERFFHADSETVLAMLALLEFGDEGLDERWRLALRGIDALLTDFGFDLESRCKLFTEASLRISKMLESDSNFEDELSEKFRRERKSLEKLLDPACDQGSPLASGFALLRQRSERMAPIAADWNALQKAGRLRVSLHDFLGSCVHMHLNRLLRSAHWGQELVISDFLARLYGSRAARERGA